MAMPRPEKVKPTSSADVMASLDSAVSHVTLGDAKSRLRTGGPDEMDPIRLAVEAEAVKTIEWNEY